jgi:hypothetical protein
MNRARILLWLYLGSIVCSLGVTFLLSTPSPQDDFGNYQSFIESLARGNFDLRIPGFHGTDVFGLLVFLVTRSSIAQIIGLAIVATLLPLCAYAAGRACWRSTEAGCILAGIVSMMPFVLFVCLRGWTGPGYWTWMLISIALAGAKSKWWGVPWALAVLSKPFAFALLPLLLYLTMDQEQPANFFRIIRAWKKPKVSHRAIIGALTGMALIEVYFSLQYFQAGRVIIGSHIDLTPGNIIQSPARIFLNMAHAIQILLSIHNYHYVNPALTGPGNMMHTTPVLIMLALVSLTQDGKKRTTLLIRLALLGAVAGLLMNALLDHMDHFYMEASILLFIIAAMPSLLRTPLWIPLTYGTLLFQWFYFYLQYKPGFLLQWWFFSTPVIIGVWMSGWLAIGIYNILKGRKTNIMTMSLHL